MRTIIAGSRSFTDYFKLVEALSHLDITCVISGGAKGADSLGEEYAKEKGIPIERYPAQWDLHGKSAGYKRNILMAEKAEALVAFWDGSSRGTKHMIDIARKKGLEIEVVRYW